MVYRKHIPGQQAALLDLLTRMIEAEKLPPPERRAAIDAIPLPPRTFENLLVYLLVPACQKMSEAETRTRATCAVTLTAIACERHRRKFGRWPGSLQAIPKDILPEVPADPFTDGPLLYRITDDGAVVYSAGKDLADNGGANLDPKGEPGTDYGFRLIDPDKRRQVPPPKPPQEDDPGALFPFLPDAPPKEREP
jgi:hypothetical protein